MSREPVWFIYVNEEQQGPFTKAQLYQKFQDQQFESDVHLFQEGWKEWKPVKDCLSDIDLPLQIDGTSVSMQDRRLKGPRVGIDGQIIVHNQGDMLIGSGVNVSETGLFVETAQQLFKVGESLILTCKVKQLSAPFHATAKVVRFNAGNGSPAGFGLQWTEIPAGIQQDIQRLTEAKKKEAGAPKKVLPPIPVGKKIA